MAKKKYKKRQYTPVEAARRRAEQEKLADEKDRAKKRMDPTARLLLYGDLVFLAVAAILDGRELISDFVSGCLTIIGVILLLLALWLQFGNRRGRGGLGKGPRL